MPYWGQRSRPLARAAVYKEKDLIDRVSGFVFMQAGDIQTPCIPGAIEANQLDICDEREMTICASRPFYAADGAASVDGTLSPWAFVAEIGWR